MNTEPVQRLLPAVYDLLKTGELEQASKEITNLLQQDLENDDLDYALEGIKYWTEKLKRFPATVTAFEKGESLVSSWKPFLSYMSKRGRDREPLLYAIKQCVFTMALRSYQAMYQVEGNIHDGELFRKMGLCYKALGDHDRALQLLEDANERNRDSPAILAELADCYALCGEVRPAKVLFREAFFQGATQVELHFLESDIVTRLVSQIQALGYTGEALMEWIPVYGFLYGVFNIKRELRALEYGKLKQAIFSLENEIKDAAPEAEKTLIPKLINHYIWLVDHYEYVKEDRARINEVLLKIKLLDADVYNKYTV